MAKRKLTTQQKRRLKSRQQSHLNRSSRSTKNTDIDSHQLGGEQSGTVITHYGATTLIEDDDFNTYRCALRQNLGSLVCGDRVAWQPFLEAANNPDSAHQGVIIARSERKSLLSRPGFAGKEKPIVANLDQLLITVAPRPELNEGLIDRYLVAAELSHIPAAIVINKCDLLSDNELEQLKQRVSLYEELNYPLFFTSSKTSKGVEALDEFVHGKSSILVGQSGVGKSSLINCYIPEAQAKTGELSDYSNKGKHTTSVSTLYHLGKSLSDGVIIDSPGVREFGLMGIETERVIDGFREFADLKGQCKFRDCKHEQEPGCAILLALQQGEISEQRFDSYQRIIQSLKES